MLTEHHQAEFALERAEAALSSISSLICTVINSEIDKGTEASFALEGIAQFADLAAKDAKLQPVNGQGGDQ